jgi:hypothetical protein
MFYLKKRQTYEDSEIKSIVTCHELTAYNSVISILWYILLRRDCTFYTRGDVVSIQESTESQLWESHIETFNVTTSSG